MTFQEKSALTMTALLTLVFGWYFALVLGVVAGFPEREIAYTARLEGGTFDVAVVDLVSRQVRQITSGRGSCEYPSWAPSGRHLVFACKRGNTWQITAPPSAVHFGDIAGAISGSRPVAIVFNTRACPCVAQ